MKLWRVNKIHRRRLILVVKYHLTIFYQQLILGITVLIVVALGSCALAQIYLFNFFVATSCKATLFNYL